MWLYPYFFLNRSQSSTNEFKIWKVFWVKREIKNVSVNKLWIHKNPSHYVSLSMSSDAPHRSKGKFFAKNYGWTRNVKSLECKKCTFPLIYPHKVVHYYDQYSRKFGPNIQSNKNPLHPVLRSVSEYPSKMKAYLSINKFSLTWSQKLMIMLCYESLCY